MVDELDPNEVAELERIERNHRALRATNPIQAARYFTTHQTEILRARELQATGRPILPLMARADDLPNSVDVRGIFPARSIPAWLK